MSIFNVSVIEQAFGQLARPLSYHRGQASHTIKGFVTYSNPMETGIVNDYDQTNMLVIILASDLEKLGMFPPKKYDKVVVDGISRNVEVDKINYVASTPVFVRLWAVG